jgi:hypothetical protein
MFFQDFVAFKQVSRDPTTQGIPNVTALIRMPMLYINGVAPMVGD